jgi:dihydroflavonol-4-reductase
VRPTSDLRALRGWANGATPTAKIGWSVVDARDAGAIHALAVDHGQPGRRYALTSWYGQQREVAEMAGRITGKKVRHLGFGPGPMKAFGALMEAGAKLTGKSPLISRATADEYVGRYQYVDGSPTWAEFGYTPLDLATTVRDGVAWLGEVGMLES